MTSNHFLICAAALSGILATSCGHNAPSPPPYDHTRPLGQGRCDPAGPGPGVHFRSAEIGGHLRIWQIHVPKGAKAASRAPVVMAFHGGMGTAQSLMSRAGLAQKAEEAGFILVAPEGTGTFQTWNAGNCCGYARREGVDDVLFVRHMLAALDAEFCVDPDRIYATGHSNGAMLSYRLACEAADLVAAIAPVGGASGQLDRALDPPADAYPCAPSRPVPVLHIHGSKDGCYRFDGGVGDGPSGVDATSVPETLATWGALNGCGEGREITLRQGAATCEAREGCAADTILCTIDGAGHVWPGRNDYPSLRICGGTTTDDLDANDLMWSFFASHPR